MNADTADQTTAPKKRGRRPLPMAQLADPIIRGWSNGAAAVGKSLSQFKRDVRAGLFPPPMDLGPNSVGWRTSWIDEALDRRPRRAYRSIDEEPRLRRQQKEEETLSI